MKRAVAVGVILLAALLVVMVGLHEQRPPPAAMRGEVAATDFGPQGPPSPSTSDALAAQAPERPVSDSPASFSESGSEVPFTAFRSWVNRYLEGKVSVSVVEGEALAWKRREAMLHLIESDPARALAQAVPFHWRTALPHKVARHFERWVDGRGALEVAMAENFDTHCLTVYRWAVLDAQRYDAFVYGRRRDQVSHQDLPLHGVLLEGKLALLAEPIRVLDSEEADALEQERGRRTPPRCVVCNRPPSRQAQLLRADVGGETAGFCSQEHLELANQNWILAEDGSGGPVSAQMAAGGGDTWTQGRKTVLYMRVNFPDDLTEPISEAAANNTMDTVNAYYVEGSYNTTWLTTTVTPLLTLPQIKAWYSTAGPGALLGDARATARKAGFDTVNYDLDIVSHTSVPGFDWGGLGAVRGKGTWLQSHGTGVTAHELGHNYGLLHANFWDTLEEGSSAIGPGTNVEYGNIFDTMGAASAGNNDFGALFKTALQWLPEAAVHDITTSGVYRVHPFDLAQRTHGRFYAARVRKDFDRDYWLEFRSRFAANASLQNGLLLNWSPWRETGGTGLIDSTPWTLTRNDAAVVLGRTFSDHVAGIHLTPLERGGVGGEAWIDVRVHFADATPNLPSCLQVEVEPPNPAPGERVNLRARVTDVDAETFAFSWMFDDGSFSTNNQAWISRTWTQPGDHVVRCVVSDMRGGLVSTNVVVTVGAPSEFRVSGRVLDARGDPVEGVRVDNGITNTTGYVSSLTDSAGRFILTGVTGEITLEATQYGLAFTHATWQNPIYLGPSFLEADFLATPLPQVSLALTTNVVSESDATPQQLTLSRTGSTEEDLTVELNLSGSGEVGTDLNFNPPLVAGLNEVVIPAGTDQVVYAISVVNNGLVEDQETVSITLLEKAGQVIASLAEATLTVLDDDQPAKPAVAIRTVVGHVPERGPDSVVFRISRTGSTAGDLPVYYSTGGTATAGTDYPTLIGVAVIPAGSSSVPLEVLPLDDKDVEPDETLLVTLTAHATYTLSEGAAAASLIDDDLLVVTVATTGAGAAEPSSAGRFTVKRDGDLTGNLVVYYTLSGTASNGVDYVSPSGAVTIPAGETSADVTLTALDDGETEGDESATLTLTGNPGYDVGIPGSATLSLRDNERVTVSVSAPDSEASEPGSDFGSFVLSRGSVVNGVLTVNLAINGTAMGGADYVPLDVPVTLPDGASAVTLDLIPFDDLHLEPVEDVILTILPGTNYNVGVRQARVTLADDESYGVPAVGFASLRSGAVENESPGLSVALSHTSSAPVSVSYRSIGGSASATDYTLPPGTLNFEPGEWAKSIPLPITGDSEVEPDETVLVTLFDPDGATHDGLKIHTYTIVDDDLASVSVTATVSEIAEGGPDAGVFRLTRTGGTNQSVVVSFQITGTASAPSDFAPLGTAVTIPAGATFVDVLVETVEDGAVELDEVVELTLISAPGGRIVSPHRATITITDNDPNSLPVVTLTSTNQPWAVEGGAPGAFLFTRTGPTTHALTLYLAYAGTAAPGGDYDALPGSLSIPAGASSVVLPVTAVEDTSIEGEETVIASLTAEGSYRTAHAAAATVTIQDNDQNVRVEATDFVAAEPGTDLGGFTFTRFGTTNDDLQVFFTLTGTAGNGVDYAALASPFTIPAGSLTATLPIVPLEDVLVEGAESLTLSLQAHPAYALATPSSATLTLLDDEPMLSLGVSTTNVVEGRQVPAVFTLTRGGDPQYEFTARLTFGGTAAHGVDYPPVETNVFFGCGIVAIDLPIYPTNELAVEPEETVTATILPDPAYTTLLPSSALLSLTDAGTNRAPEITLISPTAERIFLLGTNVNMILETVVVDEGDTNVPLTLTWTNISGPDTLGFGNTDQTHTTVSFTNEGVYVLRLTADDGQLSSFTDVTVVVDTLARLSNTLVHWTFDEGNGADVLDVSGHGHDGIVLGPADWISAGVLGGALDLSGTSNVVREAVPSGFLNARQEFTLALWLRADSTNTDHGILTGNDGEANPTLSLAMRPGASCGSSVNVIEGTLATTCCEAHQISASEVIRNDWQHVALTWRDGSAPSLYLDGALDQPDRHKIPLSGLLINCPQFVLGQGPADLTNTWNGAVDDLRIYGRALDPAEVAGLVATNYGALVQVPTNLTVQILTPVELTGEVTDDGRPLPPGALTTTWTQLSGPVTVTIPDPQAVTNTVEFTQAGDYVFRLVADDGQVKVFQDLPVTVVEPSQVFAYASDPVAAELGPDPGELTLARYGDLALELTVFLRLSGTASNGADMVFIPQTNLVTFAVSQDQLTIPVAPFLDDRTEGDETVILTVLSNLTYTVVSGEATVTIQDSPYGQWNIQQFTLEELTDPTLTGQGANPEGDDLVNFVEYAFHRNPKSVDTNSPLQTSIEISPGDGLGYITLTYPRRLLPTDVAYEVRVSNDLITWNSGEGYVEEIQALDDGNGLTETVTARLLAPWPSSTSQFITIRVWLLTTGP